MSFVVISVVTCNNYCILGDQSNKESVTFVMLSPRVMGIRLRYSLLFILLILVFIYYYGRNEGPAKANVAGLQPIVSSDGRVNVQSPLIFIGMTFELVFS